MIIVQSRTLVSYFDVRAIYGHPYREDKTCSVINHFKSYSNLTFLHEILCIRYYLGFMHFLTKK